jgi:hypothetical protein
MFRTRDFLMFLVAITILVLAIVLTLLLTDYSQVGTGVSFDTEFDTTTATYTAEVVVPPNQREERLATMRRKLSEISAEFRAPQKEEVVESESLEPTEEETTEPTLATIEECPVKRIQTIAWVPTPQQSEVRDGSRVFYTARALPPVDASSTPEVVETVLLSLPVRTEALSFTSCIPSSVVAVTPTGMPVRNTDYAQYQGLGEGTLIGYTLDGFELYGQTSTLDTDACGGAVVGGVYRYYLSAERQGVIGCFAGIPVVL